MMNTKSKIGLIILVIIVVAGGWFILNSQKYTQNSKFCVGDLEECDNQNITLEGKMVTALQHPVPSQYQNIGYLDTEHGQIVLVSEEKINCENNIKIYGLLEKVIIECGPEVIGKCPYHGYRVHVYKWKCLE